ncbi:MAG: stage V sporulation protein D, partial [Clostridiales bacterium]|nr:stage V sporulation protein D [Clostridiales bacterium]
MRKGPSKDMWKRSFTVFMAMILGLFAMDFGRLFYLQVIAGEEYQAKAQSQQLSDTTISATRGAIYDRNMNVLAQSATVWNIYINPKKITDDNRDLIVEGLGDILEYDEADKEDLLEAMEQQSSYVEVEKKVENPIKEQVSKFISDNKLGEAMGLTQSTKRYYPYNNFVSTILGFTGTDDQGLSGIESYYDSALTGTPGRIITAKDAVQNAMPSEYETTIDAQDGSSLVL